MGMSYWYEWPMKASLKEYADYDTKLAAATFYKGTNYMTQVNAPGNWLDGKRKTAELEAHRERVRQVYARAFGAAKNSSEWVQGLLYVEGANTVEDLKKVCNSFDIVWKEEGDMITKSEEIAKLKAEVTNLTNKIEKLELGRWGKEPANGTVFKIERKYERFGIGYTFAAVRAGGYWYLTGTKAESTKAYSWEGLQSWAGQYSRIWKMTVTQELVDR